MSIPQSLARNTVTGNNLITFEDGSLLATQRGDLDIKTVANTLVKSHAKTSVWGLAGAGASGRAYATLNSNENIAPIMARQQEVTAIPEFVLVRI